MIIEKTQQEQQLEKAECSTMVDSSSVFFMYVQEWILVRTATNIFSSVWDFLVHISMPQQQQQQHLSISPCVRYTYSQLCSLSRSLRVSQLDIADSVIILCEGIYQYRSEVQKIPARRRRRKRERERQEKHNGIQLFPYSPSFCSNRYRIYGDREWNPDGKKR